jgi:hypothetical protein
MFHLLQRAPMGALLLALFLFGCDGGGLTAPEAAAPEIPGLAALLDEQIETATAETAPSARALAEQAGVPLQFISGPTKIDAPGLYLVTRDFNLPPGVPADAIVVAADNVFLDLGGHTLTGPGNKIGRGVFVEDAQRVVVTGGTLETFGVGVEVNESNRVAVVGMRALGGDEFADPPNGIPPQVGFLLVNSARNRLTGNSARGTNLGFFVRGPESMRNEITGNVALAGEFGLLGVCYNPHPDDPDPAGPGPSEDRVSGNFLNGFGTGIQASAGSARNGFTFNRIYYLASPWEDLNGTNVFANNVTMQITG